MPIQTSRRLAIISAWCCACLFAVSATVFGQAPANPSANLSLKLQGIDIELDEDGAWHAIYATGTQTVSFPDRRGVNNAYVIAEERAKAAIARWFAQTVETGRLFTEASAELEKTMLTRGTGNDGVTKTAQRNLETSLTETFSSGASAVLRGVTILEQSYDEKGEEVSVKVGISRTTIAAARGVQQSMQPSRGAGRGAAAGAPASVVREDVVRPGSEVRTGRTLPGAGPASTVRPFTAARGAVRALQLRSQAEWDVYVRSGEKPVDIPANPDVVYGAAWVSWNDWLGR